MKNINHALTSYTNRRKFNRFPPWFSKQNQNSQDAKTRELAYEQGTITYQ
jgi:hypothetical protein